MFRFGEPQYLYLLIVLPLLAVFYFYSNYRRRKKLREYGSPELLAHLMPDVSKYRPDVKFWLTLSALAMVIFMLARPQFGSKMEDLFAACAVCASYPDVCDDCAGTGTPANYR